MRFVFRNTFLCLLLLISVPQAIGQNVDDTAPHSNLVIKKIPLVDSFLLDSLSIDANSFSIQGVDPSAYLLNPEKSLLIWKNKPQADSVEVRFRTLPIAFAHKNNRKSSDAINANVAFSFSPGTEKKEQNDPNFVQFNSIEFSGNYGRSLMVGNQQDVSLNSNFDLQLNGYILDSIRIEAALSDNSVPFQPDGNTQQIQEFDKIYITFEKGLHKLTAGDYELHRPNSYFLNFDKRVQGLFYQGTFPKTKTIENKIGISGSIAKGEFARNIFQGLEGNQGPYKLTANNGEQFFIVLANSEKVFIDGMLMQRGEELDYTIDYNTAEITFMPRRMITKDSRIQVEFEYQSRNYLNTLLHVYDELKIKDKWRFNFNVYSNQDAKNQPYLQELSNQQKSFLRTIGDRIGDAYYPNIRMDTLAENKVLYRLSDSIVNGIRYDSVFSYSNNPDSILYSLGFSYVGPNKGNYKLSPTANNGRTYHWIAPENNLPQGDYTPSVLLITPKKHQLFSLGSNYKIDSLKEAGIELAASNYAPNLFGNAPKTEHWGFAGKVFYKEKRYFGKKDSLGNQNWALASTADYERTQSKFKPVAPFRNIEFNRDWNLNNDSIGYLPDDQLASFNTKLINKNWGSLAYELAHFDKGAFFNGNRNLAQLSLKHNTFRGGLTYNSTQTKAIEEQSRFLRPSAFLENTFGKTLQLTLGAKWEAEQNLINLNSGQISSRSSGFNTLGLYLKNNSSNKMQYSLQYDYREDQFPGMASLMTQAVSNTLSGSLNLMQWKGQQIALTGTFRDLNVKDTTLNPSLKSNQSLLARLQYNGSILKSLITPTTLFEIGSGQQQKQEYIYVKVPTGQGMYMWVDYNNDGIQQETEFELALYPDQKQYIRLLSPTNEYVAVNFVTYNQSLMIRPQNLWMGKDRRKWQQFVGRWSNQFSLQISNRTLAEAGLAGFNPFTNSIDDDNIIANSSMLTNTLFFNQLSSVWGLDYTFLYRSGKNLLSYGLEGEAQKRNAFDVRWVFMKNFTANLVVSEGYRNHLSPVFDDGRTYFINEYSIRPGLTWINASRIRIQSNYKWEQKGNKQEFGGEFAHAHTVEMNMRLTFQNTGNISLNGAFSNIRYNGEENTSLSFIMLDALKNGQNWLWHLSWDRNIGRGIQFSLDYDGRKPASSPVIHTGTMSIRALL